MHYESDICGNQEGPGFFHHFNSYKSIQLTDLSNLTMIKCNPKELPLDFCWLHWLMPETKGSQYLVRQTFTKVHPSMVTKCFLHNCLSSWQDKIISCAVSSTEVAQRAEWKKSVTRVTEGEAWDHKVRPETEIVDYFLGKKEKTSDLCLSGFVLHLVWNYPVSTLKLYCDWQPSLILSAGWDRPYFDAH